MIDNIINNKAIKLFIVMAGFFVANALIAEFIGVKIFSLEQTLGLSPLSLSLFGIDNLSFNLTAGVLLWPFVFVLTDLINEYYGRRGVQLLSYLTAGLILYAFAMFYAGIELSPADFWPQSHINPALPAAEQQAIADKVGDYDYAYRLVFGQGLWIIIGSLVAFLIGQIIDVTVFHRIKQLTGERYIWLRATGSTLISQFIDSFVVLFIAFYLGADWGLSLVLAIGVVNYLYKFTMAILLTPVIYAVHYLIDRYLGEPLASEMKTAALRGR
ncbi:queuosine precursor transporter [Spongiibacter sp.]|uniref:queuosine precursor transporter n=1 Tax=Spongiibacter sp. TaxID=2024860 RepID=UPI0035613F9A